MANEYWTNVALDDDITNAANWSGDGPTDGDSLLFPAGVGGNPTGADLSAMNFVLVHVLPGFDGDIGASGTPLQCTCDEFIHRGNGTLYYEDKTDDSDHTDTIMIDSPNMDNAAVLTGNRFDTIVVKGGNVTVAGTVYAAFHLVLVGPDNFGGPFVTVETGAGESTTNELTMYAGTLISHVHWHDVRMSGGVATCDGTDILLSEVYMHGGTLHHNIRESGLTADIGTSHIYGGILDFTGDGRPVVSNGDVFLYPGGKVKQYQNQISWLSTGAQYLYGGTVEIAP